MGNSTAETHNIAVYIDLENVAIGCRDARYKVFDSSLVFKRMIDKGNVVTRRAYADWTKYPEYRRPLHENGVELIEISIAEAMEAYDDALAQSFEGTEPGIAEENLQARIRGNLMMALSNKFGWLVLTTWNKSELSVGYATLYGDMAGGFAVIKDIFKLLVYRLVRWRNEKEGR